ncbi:MAG TPA: alanine racemase [Clostridia bacterium]|nr:alanine racemase [Clostridia bacterium]
MVTNSVWAEVDLKAIESNLYEIKKMIGPGVLIMAVVKANAYGHGSVKVSETALSCGVNYLGVARAGEGVHLRSAGIKAPILVMGYTYPEEAVMLIKHGLTATVSSADDARFLSELAVSENSTVKIHIKVDSGMGRLGFPLGKSTERELESIFSLPGLNVEGIYTHFATADERDKNYAIKQQEGFVNLLESLHRKGIRIPIKHAANSAALIDMGETCLDMVRAGIAMYGCYPSQEVRKDRLILKPAMELKTRVSMVKRVKAGFKVSYGVIYEAGNDTTLATLSVGYADGYNRLLSNNGEVLIQGKRAPIAGRICMDQCVVDIGDAGEAEVGDEVVLFGRQGDGFIPVEEVAARVGTINYEVLCAVSDRVPRVYLY